MPAELTGSTAWIKASRAAPAWGRALPGLSAGRNSQKQHAVFSNAIPLVGLMAGGLGALPPSLERLPRTYLGKEEAYAGG